jgi:3-deoxy-D-manno-octulosonic-acid transferase
MIRAIYTLVLWLLAPVILIRLFLRSRGEIGYGVNLGERFGHYKMDRRKGVIWVHAVSVGEVRASVPLVAVFKANYPDKTILVTCMTAAGREAIEQAYGSSVLHGFLPYDYPFAVSRFLDHFKPCLGVLMETEIWLNLIAECRRRSIPIALANARMSARSARGYHRLGALVRPAFESIGVVCAQSEQDANRIASLGAHRVRTSGNLKFDAKPDPNLVAGGCELKRSISGKKVLVLASTREGEEALLLDALAGKIDEDIFLIVVPRHPQRFEMAATLVADRGLPFARRSRGEVLNGVSVLIGDTMGEMPFYYAAADVAIVGGSLLPYGGQNFIEASALGVPVVIGPHVRNFSEATRLAVKTGAAVQVKTATEAILEAIALLRDPARREAMGRAGLVFCEEHRGATQRHFTAIDSLLSQRGR